MSDSNGPQDLLALLRSQAAASGGRLPAFAWNGPRSSLVVYLDQDGSGLCAGCADCAPTLAGADYAQAAAMPRCDNCDRPLDLRYYRPARARS